MIKRKASGVFSELPHSPLNHFHLHFYASVYRLIHHIERLSEYGGVDLEAIFSEFPFLGTYFSELFAFLPDEIEWDQGLIWWEHEIHAWEQSCTVHLPLLSLERKYGIDFRKRIALALVGLVEEDSRFSILFEKLQAPLPYRQPCQEFLGQILLDSTAEEMVDAWEIFRFLEASGLFDITNKDAPRSEWLPRVPPLLWNIISGCTDSRAADWDVPIQPSSFHSVQDLIYPHGFIQQLIRVPNVLAEGTIRVIVLRGTQGSDSLQILGAIARALNLGVIRLPEESIENERFWKMVGPLCVMRRAMPILSFDLHPGETIKAPALGTYRGPVGIIMGHEGGLSGPLVDKALSLQIPLLPAAQRLRRWEQAFADCPVENLTEINQRFQLPGGYIRKLASISIAHAELEEQETVKAEHVQEASRSLNRQMLDKLATRLEVNGSWDRLIVSPATATKLRELEQRCLHRERILDHLGPAYGGDANRGVRALFSGKSGTGKTMAAKILASVLGMDLYRVDLAAVINKYVGETEKNLHRVLSRAEELDVVLLLDEGDALLGNRTEVKSANDRFANLETNYLLQKLETYQGVVVVTSNVSENIDRAFQRRMDVVINFVPPRAEERLHIWKLHLPSNHAVDRAYLDEVSSRCVMTGGQIRNAALFATLLALDEGCVVQQLHLKRAIQSEYQKAGAANPFDNGNSSRGRQRDLLEFANLLG